MGMYSLHGSVATLCLITITAKPLPSAVLRARTAGAMEYGGDCVDTFGYDPSWPPLVCDGHILDNSIASVFDIRGFECDSGAMTCHRVSENPPNSPKFGVCGRKCQVVV